MTNAANLKPYLVAVVLIAGAFVGGMCSGANGKTEALTRAAVAEEATRTAEAQRDSARAAAQRRLSEVERMEAAYAADSAAWEAERQSLRGQARAARRDASEARQRLLEVGDSTVQALVDELQAAHDREISALVAENEALLAERTALLAGRDTLRNAIEKMLEVDQLNQQVIASLEDQVSALRDAARPPWYRRLWSEAPKYALGAAVGLVAGVALTR